MALSGRERCGSRGGLVARGHTLAAGTRLGEGQAWCLSCNRPPARPLIEASNRSRVAAGELSWQVGKLTRRRSEIIERLQERFLDSYKS